MSFSNLMMAARERQAAYRDNEEKFNLRGGLPRKRLRFLVHIDGKPEGVIWEASGEVRTIEPGDYLGVPCG